MQLALGEVKTDWLASNEEVVGTGWQSPAVGLKELVPNNQLVLEIYRRSLESGTS
jgi:hypothetical protein